MGLLRKTVRIGTLGLAGESPRNRQHKAAAKNAKAQADLAKAEAARVREGIKSDLRTSAVPPTPALGQSGWHPDPAGRAELRWWDGRGWTDDVTRAGAPGKDPLG